MIYLDILELQFYVIRYYSNMIYIRINLQKKLTNLLYQVLLQVFVYKFHKNSGDYC